MVVGDQMKTHTQHLVPAVAARGEMSERLKQRLEGDLVVLEPLEPHHGPDLFEASRDPVVWRWILGSAPSRELFDLWFQHALDEAAGRREVPFATLDRATGRPIGATRYLALRPEHRGLEIGGTWLTPTAWQTGANIEAKLLMLDHAFERLRCLRVEFKADARNARSRAALAALPAAFEGSPSHGRSIWQRGTRLRLLQHHPPRLAGRASELDPAPAVPVVSAAADRLPHERAGCRSLPRASPAIAITVRSRLEPGDLAAIVRLHGRQAAEHGLDASFEVEVARGLTDLAIAWTRSPDAGRLWLAGPADDPLGSIAITRERADLARLRWFVVVHGARRRGLGRRLLDDALAYVRARGFVTVELDTIADLTVAAAMYRQAGFEVVASAHVERWGRRLEARKYRLSLLSPPRAAAAGGDPKEEHAEYRA